MAVTTSMGLSSTMGIATVTGAWQPVKMKINNLSGEFLLVFYCEQKLSETRKPHKLNFINKIFVCSGIERLDPPVVKIISVRLVS